MIYVNQNCVRPQLYNNNYGKFHNARHGTIFIAVNQPYTKIWTCNEIVKGVVCLKKSVSASRVTIKFKARSIYRLHGAETEFELFSYTKPLIRRDVPSSTASDTHFEYPFTFQFPEVVEEQPSPQYNTPLGPNECFEHENGHMLPPTLWLPRGQAQNDYFLEAEVFTNVIVLTQVVRQQLRFTPSTPAPSAIPEPFLVECTSSRLERKTRLLDTKKVQEQKEIGSRLAKFKERIKADHSDDPYATFSIALSTPKELRVGSSVPIKISLSHLDRSQEVLEPPLVILRGIRAQAIAHIQTRVPNSLASRDGASRNYIEQFELFNRRFKGDEGILIFDGVTLEDLSLGLSVDKIVPPSFKTYGVMLKYDLKFKLWVECVGQVFEVEKVRKNVTILPMYRRAEIGSSVPENNLEISDEMVMVQQMGPPPAEPPPPYEA